MGNLSITILCHIIIRPTLNKFWKTLLILQKKTPKLVAKILATKFGFVPDCLVNKNVDHSDVVAALQLHLHSRHNTCLQWNGQRQMQNEMRNIQFWHLVPYIRGLTVVKPHYDAYLCTCIYDIVLQGKAQHFSFVLTEGLKECTYKNSEYLHRIISF